jgi:sulfur carrier protein
MTAQDAIRIRVNGEEREFASEITVAALLDLLGVTTPRVAVEFNREILSKSRYLETRLSDGDSVEVVQFVGGG